MTTKMKNEFWVIKTREVISNKVSFGMEVTKEEAIEMFIDGDYEDIIDHETEHVEEVWIDEK